MGASEKRDGLRVTALPQKDAGRELDALVAEHVMGWVPLGIGPRGITAGGEGPLAPGWVGFWDGNWTRWTAMPEPTEEDEERAVPWSPSTDIAAAWEVVEKCATLFPAHEQQAGVDRMMTRYPTTVIDRGTVVYADAVYYWRATLRQGTSADAKTAPLAICLAALKAVGHD
jgi:ABA sandwich protein